MAEDKKSFVLYSDYKELFNELSDEDAGQLIKHILSYVNDENPESKNPMVKVSFIPIKHQLKRDLKKYEEKKEQWSDAGKKSAEARRLKREQEERERNERSTESTNVENVATESTVNVTVTDNVNVTVTDIKETHTGKSKRFIPPSKIEIEEFCFDNLIEIDIGHFIDHYTANGWKVGKNTMKDWKATVRNWNRNKDNFKNNNNGKRTNDDGTALINWVNGN